jgi:hypothetical protein
MQTQPAAAWHTVEADLRPRLTWTAVRSTRGQPWSCPVVARIVSEELLKQVLKPIPEIARVLIPAATSAAGFRYRLRVQRRR